MWASVARALAVGWISAEIFAWLHSPLPWLIGPLLVTAVLRVRGVDLRCPVALRNAGQWAIGTVLGLYFTPEVVGGLRNLALPLVLGVVWAFVVGLVVAWSLRRFAHAHPATAFFAGAVGGASEMAVQGERNGGEVESIAAAHGVRVLLVACTLPFAYQWIGVAGSESWAAATRIVEPRGLAALVAATAAGGALLSRARLANAWVVGPLAASTVLAAAGLALSAVPHWVTNAGQLFIGMSLGASFRPGFASRAPRLVAIVVPSTIAAIALSSAFAWLLALAIGFPGPTMILAMAPGGITEMALTARQLGLGVPVVTAFHVVRIVAMVFGAGALYRRIAQWRDWPVGVVAESDRPGIDRRIGGDGD